MMKTIKKLGLLTFSSLGMVGLSHGAVIALAGDSAHTSSALAGSVDNTLNDTFAYNELNPTTPLPVQAWNANDGYHGHGGHNADITLAYTVTGGYTTVAGEKLVVDLYGRDNNFDRDDNVDVLLFDGGTTVATVAGVKIDEPNHYARAEFSSLAAGTHITGMQIIGHDSNDGDNYFTLMETRMATVPTPEPSSAMLFGLGGLALILRRRK